MKIVKALLTTLLLISCFPTIASEADYVKAHCQGIIEYRLPDLTRVDCLDDEHAWEYDFGKKWAEAIGQALHYASHTGRRAGIVLIIEDNRDRLGYNRAKKVISHYGLNIDLQKL